MEQPGPAWQTELVTYQRKTRTPYARQQTTKACTGAMGQVQSHYLEGIPAPQLQGVGLFTCFAQRKVGVPKGQHSTQVAMDLVQWSQSLHGC